MTTNNPTAPASPPPEGRAYTDEQLIYAATSRCPCGAALAYVPGDPRGAWDCSAILTGRAIPAGQPGSVQHTDRLSFVLWEVKSERQPTEGRDLATQFVSTGGEETIAADLRAMEEASFHILNEKARMLYAEAPANAGDFDPEAIEDLLAHCEVRSARTMEPRKSEWKRRAAAVRALAAQAREVEGLRSRVAEIGEQLNLAAAQNYCTMCGVTPEDEASREATTPTPEPARDGGGAEWQDDERLALIRAGLDAVALVPDDARSIDLWAAYGRHWPDDLAWLLDGLDLLRAARATPVAGGSGE